MILNHGKTILYDHYEKHHLKGAQRRLLLASLAACGIVTLFAVLAIQVCAGMCMFVPA
jgi:hypothetical protein